MKNLEILLYNNEELKGIAYCKKHNVGCKVEIKIKRKSKEIVLTYHISEQKHFYNNLASEKCKGCYYFEIRGLKLENNCEAEAKYYFKRRDRLRLTLVCKDNGRLNYPKQIEVEVKEEKIKYKNEKK
jgi:hypothetical protein